MTANPARRLVAWLALAYTSASFAQGGPAVVGDLFDARPRAATVHGRSCEVAQLYVELINSKRYDELHTLFAANAVFLTPVGKVLQGPRDIGEFYKSMVGSLQPDIVPVSFISDGDACVMELAAKTNRDDGEGYRLSAIDHFTVNAEGKIINMIVYLRPDRQRGM